MATLEQAHAAAGVLPKCPTGIVGLDEMLLGGLPRGRPTLVCGSAGVGKTLLAMEFLVRGARDYGEPGVFLTFEESTAELVANVASLGFDVPRLVAEKKLVVDEVQLSRADIVESGEYDLEGLFIRLGEAIASVGAKRVVLDTIEVLFSVFQNNAVVRSELGRLFRWLKERQVTAIVTGERGEGVLTRAGLEEYIADCVILLDHRIVNQISTRRLRVVKYRGSVHGTNEYPFLISSKGMSLLPISSAELRHGASTERISIGVPDLDQMLGGSGVYRGSTVLLSGTAGSGKTTLACKFVDAACARGERALYFASEESPEQVLRNMRSVAMELQRWRECGLLHMVAERPTACGLEMHLLRLHETVHEFRPHVVVFDPITNLASIGPGDDVKSMLLRSFDFLKTQEITVLATTLTAGVAPSEDSSEVGISSLMDVWILLRNLECSGERNRALYILKARGIPHSNQIREFSFSEDGVRLRPPYVGMANVLTGSARLAQEAADRDRRREMEEEIESHKATLQARQRELAAEIEALRARMAAEEQHALREIRSLDARQNQIQRNAQAMALSS